ncbi:MAG: rhodanese-like domain-containing protein [Candidatus Binataceae bacterium]
MTSAEARRHTNLPHDLPRDLTGVLGVALVALIAGLVVNRLRQSPLPLVYHTPEQRLAAELTQLVNAPPFRLEDLDTVGLDEFRGLVKSGQALVVDARAASFYGAGHVPGALNLSRQDFAGDYQRLRPTLDKAKDSPVVVYCSGGECHDSRLVASALISLGYTHVRIFTGGWAAWTASGAPIAQ